MFSTFFGKKAKVESNTVIPTGFTDVQTVLPDGALVIGTIDFSCKNFTQKNLYPWSLKLLIGLRSENLLENGLPNRDELQIANKIEVELLEEMKKYSSIKYIGHFFHSGVSEIYVYLNNPERVHNYLQTEHNKENRLRKFGYEINEDPNWLIIKNLF